MATKFRSELEIGAPPAKVYEAITDLDDWSSWMPNLVRVERLSEGPFQTGSRWRETRKMFGKEASEVFEVTMAEPSSRLELYVDGSQGSSRKGEYRFAYRFEPAGAGTRVFFDAEIDMPGMLAKLLGPLLAGTFRKACEKDHRALKAHLEGTA